MLLIKIILELLSETYYCFVNVNILINSYYIHCDDIISYIHKFAIDRVHNIAYLLILEVGIEIICSSRGLLLLCSALQFLLFLALLLLSPAEINSIH